MRANLYPRDWFPNFSVALTPSSPATKPQRIAPPSMARVAANRPGGFLRVVIVPQDAEKSQ